jgi:D-alanyl-D-alanine carboxypeptidase
MTGATLACTTLAGTLGGAVVRRGSGSDDPQPLGPSARSEDGSGTKPSPSGGGTPKGGISGTTPGQEGRARDAGSGREASSAHDASVGFGGASGSGHPLAPRLDALLDELSERRGVHGALMLVATGDGHLHWSGARGEAAPGGPPLTPDTPFFTASITKLFIAASILRLVEEGKLGLHDRLIQHLPEERIRGLHIWEGVDQTGQITVEQLLAHASGLPDFIEDYPARGSEDPRSLVEILVEEGDRDWSLDETVARTRETLKPHFLPQPLGEQRATRGRGGRRWGLLARRSPRIRYSDTGYQLLMALVAARTGAPFHEALASLVLEPLGLEETWVPGHPRPGIPEKPVATLMAGDEVLALPRFFQALGDVNSTATDLLAFMRALVEGRLFRDPESWRRMTHPWRRFSHPLDRAALRQPSWPIEYGLGVMRFRLPPLLTRFRRLPSVWGHTGSTGTWLFHAPELDLYLVGAVNQVEAGALPYRFVPRILGEAVKHLSASVASQPRGVSWARHPFPGE